SNASRTLSSGSCRITRHRPAPMLSRTAISRLRAVARASNKLATLAQAIARMNPTSAISAYSGFEYCRRIESSPPPPSTSFASHPLPLGLGRALHPAMERTSQRGLRLRDADARPQPRHNLNPVEVLIQIHRCRTSGERILLQQQVRVHRQKNVRRLAGL